jgi:CheY-like chemotaxis protein
MLDSNQPASDAAASSRASAASAAQSPADNEAQIDARDQGVASDRDSASGEEVASTGDVSTGDVPSTAARHRVLVVESDVETADLMVTALENAGYEVEVATDGQYALMLLDSFEPQLILLALTLPGLSGLEVTQILRGEPRFAQRFRATRIFYLTDKAHMLEKRFSSLPGTPMADYLFTPIDVSELLDKARRVFADPSPRQ